MKRFLLLCALVLVCFSTHSQTTEPSHLEFKGIPLTGNYKSFAQKLVAQGCKITSTEEDITALEGSFVGRDCTMGVVGTPISKTVWKVAATLPRHYTWGTLKSEYDNLKAQYSAKYGAPSVVDESVSESYLEGQEWNALTLGKCTYRSDWYTDTGIIWIEITEQHHINIHYQDDIGVELRNKEIQSDI